MDGYERWVAGEPTMRTLPRQLGRGIAFYTAWDEIVGEYMPRATLAEVERALERDRDLRPSD
jgi:hypothetical protein